MMEDTLISRDECKSIQLDLLDIIDMFCRKYDIKYSLGYGSLIGAIRHKGFIPWDDDIDVFMLRTEYEKLLDILRQQTEYPFLTVLDSSLNEYYYPFAKIIDNRTIAKMEDNTTPHGIWVDVFPLDNLPNASLKCKSLQKRCLLYRAVVISMTTDFTGVHSIKKILSKKVLSMYAAVVGKKAFLKKYIKLQKKNNSQNSDYVGNLFTPYKNECYPRDWFNEYQDVEFEGKTYKAISQYDKYLTLVYGDYMTVPPKNKRKDHHITAMWINANKEGNKLG